MRSFGYRGYSLPAKDADPEKAASRTSSQGKGPRNTENAGPATGWRGFGWRPESFSKAQASEMLNLEEKPRLPSSSVATQPSRSTPVAVPQRNSARRSPKDLSSNETQHRRGSQSTQGNARYNDGRPIPQSVAAILASTSIPKKKQFNGSRSVPQRMSTQQLMDEWRSDEINETSSISSSPTLELLLSPPKEDRFFGRSDSFDSLDDITRSVSAESMPSLAVDDSSILSWESPSTPNGPVPRKSRAKKYSLRDGVDHTLDHPLSPSYSNNGEEEPSYFGPHMRHPSPSQAPVASSGAEFQPTVKTPKPSAFKSNLTASLNSLRNSIRNSFSNFSVPTPYSLPEDHLSRGLFSDKLFPYRSEMRPRPLDRPPTPEMRRYLNPSTYHFPSSGQELHLHGHGDAIEHVDLEAAASVSTSPSAVDDPNTTMPERGAVIALQPYSRASASPTKKASSTAANHRQEVPTEAGRGPEQGSSLIRRELRENGEFLRVCVLEMNMRRAGKFGDGLGRARLWLPPRQEGFASALQENQHLREGQEVPKRWIGVSM